VGNRVLVSGHGALDAGGAPTGPFGRVPTDVSLEAAQGSARATAVAMLASLQRSLGTLDRVHAWLSVNGFVHAEEAYPQTTAVLNPFSELILDVFGRDIGAHARTAIGVRALPLNLPVIVAAEIMIHS
jgi:enamine deaminase RidA (YjgF/YER057c/UK114 family)